MQTRTISRRPRIVRFSVAKALNWELHKETLRHVLVDSALIQLGAPYLDYGLGAVRLDSLRRQFVVTVTLLDDDVILTPQPQAGTHGSKFLGAHHARRRDSHPSLE